MSDINSDFDCQREILAQKLNILSKKIDNYKLVIQTENDKNQFQNFYIKNNFLDKLEEDNLFQSFFKTIKNLIKNNDTSINPNTLSGADSEVFPNDEEE